MSTDNAIIIAVTALLQQYGLLVERINRKKGCKTPDLIARDELGISYVIEVKTKFDDHEFRARRDATLGRGELFEDSSAIAPDKSLSEKLEHAGAQLAASEGDIFRVVFYLCTGVRAEVAMEKIKATLYGIRNLFGLGISYSSSVVASEQSYCRPCYYFTDSIFSSHRDHMDAAIILWMEEAENKWILCLNDYSPNYRSLKKSHLYRIFGETGVIDPITSESSGSAFLFKEEFDRTDPHKVLLRLGHKYDDRTINIMPMLWHSASISEAQQGKDNCD